MPQQQNSSVQQQQQRPRPGPASSNAYINQQQQQQRNSLSRPSPGQAAAQKNARQMGQFIIKVFYFVNVNKCYIRDDIIYNNLANTYIIE